MKNLKEIALKLEDETTQAYARWMYEECADRGYDYKTARQRQDEYLETKRCNDDELTRLGVTKDQLEYWLMEKVLDEKQGHFSMNDTNGEYLVYSNFSIYKEDNTFDIVKYVDGRQMQYKKKLNAEVIKDYIKRRYGNNEDIKIEDYFGKMEV